MIENLNLRKAIEMAVITEQLGAEFYARMQTKFADQKDLVPIFERLTKDEKAHEAQFKMILEKTPDERPGEKLHEQYQYLRAMAISEHFRKDFFADTKEIKSPVEALGRALGFERSTLDFYKAIRDIVGDHKELNEIIEAEKTHVIAIMKVITADAEFRGTGYIW